MFPKWLSHLALAGNGGLLALLLFLITGAVFFQSLGDDFVAWDDDHTFYQNPHIQGLDAGRIHWMFTNVDYSMRYKPLSWLAYALIFKVNGMDPFGFHFASLLFHCLNAVLVFFVLRRLLRLGFVRDNPGPPEEVMSLSAALGSLLWAVHPLRVEAVARATDMTYSQTFFFTLISLWCHLRAVAAVTAGKPAAYWHAGAITAFAIAMFSYPFLVAYPVVLIVLDFYPLRRFNPGRDWWRDAAARRVWLEKVPFILLAGVLVMTFYGRIHPAGAFVETPVDKHFSNLSRMMQGFYIWAYYLWKPWFPFNLSSIYTTLIDFNPVTLPFLASAGLITGLSVLLIWKRRAWPLGLALWVCHLALLVPALGLTEHPHYASDRYSYVDGLLWPILLAVGSVHLFQRRNSGLLAAVMLLLAIASGALSVAQVQIWRDTPTLFNYMIEKVGDHPVRNGLLRLLGAWYADRNRMDDAAAQFERAITGDPRSAQNRDLLGTVLLQEGRAEEAAVQFREAIRLAPDDRVARENLDIIQQQTNAREKTK